MLGGARSGKSAFAEQLVASEAVRYVATAVVDPADADFAERIAAHRARRPAAWTIVEGDPVAALSDATPVTLVDDLGTWLTARLDARAAWESPRGIVGPDIDALVAAVAGYGERLIIVSPEVGLGVIPATASGRLFRDEIGTLNQRLAEVCDEVFLVVAGQALQVKPDRAIASAAALSDAATSPVAVATSTHSAASAADRVVAQAGSTAAATSVTGEAMRRFGDRDGRCRRRCGARHDRGDDGRGVGCGLGGCGRWCGR